MQLESPPKHIFATCRNPSKAEELNSLAAANKGKVHVLQLEVTDFAAFEKIKGAVEEIVGENGLNLLINNAAIFPVEENASIDSMRKTYEVNCMAPYFLTQTMLPLLKKASTKNAKIDLGVERSAIVMISSDSGSITITEAEYAGYLAYSCSKSALNMMMKHLSKILNEENILVASIHPGWVQTDMGNSANGEAEITTDESCSKMVKTLFELNKADQGAFKDYNNKTLPW